MHADSDGPLSAEALARYRAYLAVLARQMWPAHLRGRLDPSDVVQQTLIEAHQTRHRFQGTDERALAAWLRAILANNLRDAIKAQGRIKRDVGRERALADALATASVRLEDCLAAQQRSPRSDVIVQEELLRMAAALERLPPDQRAAIELHHLQGLSLAETAARLERSAAAAAGLIHRGLVRLRAAMATDENGGERGGDDGGEGHGSA